MGGSAVRFVAAVLVFSAIVTAGTARGADRQRNIFDDDWTPPKTAEKARPPVTVIPPAQPPADAPAKNATSKQPLPKVTPAIPAAPKAPARLPVPAKSAQAAVRQVMKEVYGEQLADRSVAARRKLASALLAQADKSRQVPTDQFVLLVAAIDAAVDGVNLPAALQAADRMADAFDVDGLGVKADAALRLGPKSGSAESAAAENIDAVLGLSRELASADDFATAARVCAALQPAAARDAAMRAQLQQRQRELVTARDAADRFAKDLERLKASPDDPAANLGVGRYTCFVKGEWDAGLPMLAKGADSTLKMLAVQELAHSTTAEETTAVADAWWDLSAKQPDVNSRAAVTDHAATLYERCVSEIAGLRKVQIEKRIAEAAKLSGSNSSKRALANKGVVDLLKLIDLKRDTVKGVWKVDDSGGLVSPSVRDARVVFRYQPPEEYDFHIEFTRLSGEATTVQMVAHGGHRCVWLVGLEDRIRGFENIDRRGVFANATAVKGPAISTIGQRYSSVVKVRKDGLAAYLDGTLVAEYKTDGSDLSVTPHWNIGESPLGIGTSSNETVFHVAEIREVTGRGHPIP
jgi:hypothetical protein